MRVLVLALAAGVLAAPALAQSDAAAPAAAPKTKKVCRFVDTGNPMKIERRCKEVAIKEDAAAATPATSPANDQVALRTQPQP